MIHRIDDASTPLDPDECEGLRLSHLATRAELNAAEQANVLSGLSWAARRRRDVLEIGFICRLHERLFGEVWAWAGRYRLTGKNVGVDASRIAQELGQLIDDCRYWVEHGTFPLDEIAARFHHRLTLIHAFPNGNGRHARIATDLLLAQLGRPPFSWGRGNLVDDNEVRRRYVAALRAADQHDLKPLLAFVRS